MLFAVSEATVPKISVVMRKSYGAGYFVMNGYAYEPDYFVAWPTAEIAVMGPDGAVSIIHRKTSKAFPRRSARRSGSSSLRRSVRTSILMSPRAMASSTTSSIPAETRHAIWRGLQASRDKQVDRPWRKHGVLPV